VAGSVMGVFAQGGQPRSRFQSGVSARASPRVRACLCAFALFPFHFGDPSGLLVQGEISSSTHLTHLGLVDTTVPFDLGLTNTTKV